MNNLIIIAVIVFFLFGCKEKKKSASEDHDYYYTCSMHPQIMAEKPGKCPICHMDLIKVSKVKSPASNEMQLSNEQIQLANIRVDTIKSSTIGNETVLPATINFNERLITTVSARLTGRIEKLNFRNIGDYVSKGAAVYDLYSEELNSAKQEFVLLIQKRKSLGNNLINFDQLIESARTKLILWGMTRVQVYELERTNKTSFTTRFYSTANGYITSINVLQGDYVNGGQSIMRLANTSSLWAEAQVYTSQATQINYSGKVIVELPEIGKEVEGKIEFLNPEVNPQSRINLLRVSIPNNGNLIKPGMSGFIKMNNNNKTAITLPIDAVIRSQNMSMVWVKTGDNRFSYRVVSTGIESGDRIEIINGLKQGDVVVVSGAYLLDSEFRLRNGGNTMGGHDMNNM
ncbi:efflux RND transporter periplasmic adaptor subunit [soil metagenome]